MMTRSAEEWEMSRSCQRGTFSNPAIALERTTRARPLICSQVTGFRLCGIADELLGLANLGTLQMTDFRRNLVEGAGNHRERCQVVSVTIPLDDLRRHCSRL